MHRLLPFHRKTLINLSLPGNHNVSNALASIAIAMIVNVPINLIKIGLSNLQNIPKRLEHFRINKYVTIIDDSYNSNINSIISAIQVLNRISGYKIIVIGDIQELGKQSIFYHLKIKHIILSSKIDEILSFGNYSQYVSINNYKAKHFNKVLDILLYLKKKIHNVYINTTILFKSSRDKKLDTIINVLLKKDI